MMNFDMARFKQSKGITEKMLNAIMTINDIDDVKKRKGANYKPMISPTSSSPHNPYAGNEWLFTGIGKKKER